MAKRRNLSPYYGLDKVVKQAVQGLVLVAVTNYATRLLANVPAPISPQEMAPVDTKWNVKSATRHKLEHGDTCTECQKEIHAELTGRSLTS